MSSIHSCSSLFNFYYYKIIEIHQHFCMMIKYIARSRILKLFKFSLFHMEIVLIR